MRHLSPRPFLQWCWRQRRRLLVLILIVLAAWGGKTLYDRLTASDAKWRAAMTAGDAAVAADDYDTASRCYRRAIGEARKFGRNDARLAKSLIVDAQTSLRYSRTPILDGFYLASEDRVRSSKQSIFEDIRSDFGFENIVESFNELSQIKILESIITKAEHELSEAQHIASHTNKLSEDELITLYELRAQLCGFQAKGDEAIALFKRCIAVRKHYHGANHPLVADSYMKLGSLYSLKRDQYSCYAKAYQIYLNTPGPDGRDLYYAAYRLSDSCYWGTSSANIALWNETAGTLKAKYGSRNRSYIRALEKLGRSYESAQYYHEAEATYTLALITDEYRMKNRRVYSSLQNYYRQRKEYNKEKLLYLRLLKIRVKLYGCNSIQCAEVYSALASYHSTHKNPLQQIEYSDKQYSINVNDLIASVPYRRPEEVQNIRDWYIRNENELITLSRVNHRPDYAACAKARIKRLRTVGPQPVLVPAPPPPPPPVP